jgi:hypothetical protein
MGSLVDLKPLASAVIKEVAEGKEATKALEERGFRYHDLWRLLKKEPELMEEYTTAQESAALVDSQWFHAELKNGIKNGMPNNSGPALKSFQWSLEQKARRLFGSKPDTVVQVNMYNDIIEQNENTGAFGDIVTVENGEKDVE